MQTDEKITILSTGEFLVKEGEAFKKITAGQTPKTKEEIRAIIEKNIVGNSAEESVE